MPNMKDVFTKKASGPLTPEEKQELSTWLDTGLNQINDYAEGDERKDQLARVLSIAQKLGLKDIEEYAADLLKDEEEGGFDEL